MCGWTKLGVPWWQQWWTSCPPRTMNRCSYKKSHNERYNLWQTSKWCTTPSIHLMTKTTFGVPGAKLIKKFHKHAKDFQESNNTFLGNLEEFFWANKSRTSLQSLVRCPCVRQIMEHPESGMQGLERFLHSLWANLPCFLPNLMPFPLQLISSWSCWHHRQALQPVLWASQLPANWYWLRETWWVLLQ